MKITYTAKNVTLRDNFKERVEKKLKKYERVFSENAETDCNFTPGVKKSGMPKRVG